MSSTSDGTAITATKLATALNSLTNKLDEHLEKRADIIQRLAGTFQRQPEVNPPDFFKDLQAVRLPVIYMFADLFKSLGAFTHAELEDLWKPFYSLPAVREAVDDFIEVQDRFHEMFKDFKIPLPKDQSKLGEEGPLDIPLVNPRTGERSSIRDYIGEWTLLVILLRHYL